MQTLYVITTGGTIDKVYLEQTGSVANLDTKIDQYLRRLRLPGPHDQDHPHHEQRQPGDDRR